MECFRSDTDVIDVHRCQRNKSHLWKVTSRQNASNEEESEYFDAVVVATGNYDKESWPEIAGLKEWKAASSDRVIHSKQYRNTIGFKKKASRSFIRLFCR